MTTYILLMCTHRLSSTIHSRHRKHFLKVLKRTKTNFENIFPWCYVYNPTVCDICSITLYCVTVFKGLTLWIWVLLCDNDNAVICWWPTSTSCNEKTFRQDLLVILKRRLPNYKKIFQKLFLRYYMHKDVFNMFKQRTGVLPVAKG